jgi:hypothetical protein
MALHDIPLPRPAEEPTELHRALAEHLKGQSLAKRMRSFVAPAPDLAPQVAPTPLAPSRPSGP